MNAVFGRKPVRRGPAIGNEAIHEFLEREGRPETAPIRDWIEHWYGQLPPAKQSDIRGRLRSGDIRQFTSAYFELQMFAKLRNAGYEVTVEPTLADGQYNPDFLAQLGDERFYLEATVCGQGAGELRGTRNEEDAVEKIRAAFEDASVDLHSDLWLEAEGELNRSLAKTRLARPFIDLLKRTSGAEVHESYRSDPYGHWHRREYRAEFKYDGWTLQGVLEPKLCDDAAGQVWGAARTAMGDASEAIRWSLAEKAGQWKRMGPPDGVFLVAISICHSQFFWNDGDEARAIMESPANGNPTASWRDEFNSIDGILFVEDVSLGNEKTTRARLAPNPERGLSESFAPLMTVSRLAMLTGFNDGAEQRAHP